MFGNPMISAQTGKEGLQVTKLLIADGVEIDRELYLAITTDRASGTNLCPQRRVAFSSLRAQYLSKFRFVGKYERESN